MLCFQSVLYCIVLYNDVFTFLYVAVGNKLLLLHIFIFNLTLERSLRNERDVSIRFHVPWSRIGESREI